MLNGGSTLIDEYTAYSIEASKGRVDRIGRQAVPQYPVELRLGDTFRAGQHHGGHGGYRLGSKHQVGSFVRLQQRRAE